MYQKRMIALLSMLCSLAYAGDDLSMQLSKNLAPFAKIITDPTQKIENFTSCIQVLQKEEYSHVNLLQLPVVDEQLPPVSKSLAMYAVTDQDNNINLIHSLSEDDVHNNQLVGRFMGTDKSKRYIPLIHIINKKHLKKHSDKNNGTVEMQIDTRGHNSVEILTDYVNGYHYYNFLQLLADFNRVDELHMIAEQIVFDNLYKNVRFYTALNNLNVRYQYKDGYVNNMKRIKIEEICESFYNDTVDRYENNVISKMSLPVLGGITTYLLWLYGLVN